MAQYDGPQGVQWQGTVELFDMETSGRFLNDPSLAPGDVTISKNHGALANLATLPTVSPSGSPLVLVTVAASENNVLFVTVLIRDQDVPPVFADRAINLRFGP